VDGTPAERRWQGACRMTYFYTHSFTYTLSEFIYQEFGVLKDTRSYTLFY
jgi:hypothetical protein